MYIYVWLGHFAIQQKLTDHYKPTIIEQIKILKNKKERKKERWGVGGGREGKEERKR